MNYFNFKKIVESTKATIRRHKAGALTSEQRKKFIKRQEGKIAKIDKEGKLSARASQVRDTIKAVSEGAKETSLKAGQLANKETNPSKKEILNKLAGKSWMRHLNPTGIVNDNEGGRGNKSLRRQGHKPLFVEGAAWTRSEGKNPEGGLNKKGVESYRRENPGSKLQTAVTTHPSKLKKGSKKAKRRLSFCRRMKGMKRKLTSAKTARDPNSRINKSLRKWNC